MALAPNVGYGKIKGKFRDWTGRALPGTATIKPRFTVARNVTAAEPETILPPPAEFTILEDGTLPETDLPASNDPDLGVEGDWTYQISFEFDGSNAPTYGPFDFHVPEGETVDLTVVGPAAVVDAVQITRGFGVPDPADAEDGDVVSYDATAGATTWWSRSQAIGQAVAEEYEDPDSPLRASIDAAAARVADEALESRLSRVDRTRHAPSLNVFFPEAEGGDVAAALLAAAPTRGTVDLGAAAHDAPSTLTVPDGVVLRGGSIITQTAGRMISLGSHAQMVGVTVDAPGSVLGTMGAVEFTGAGATIRRGRFTSTDRDAWHIAVKPSATDTRIIDTHFDRCAVGVFVNPGVHGITVEGCTFTDWTNRCISLNATSAGYSKVRIRNNEFGPLSPDTTADAPRVAVYIRSSAAEYTIRDVEISGNAVYGNGLGHSDESMGPADMLSLHRLEDARVTGNYLIDPGEVGIHVGQGSRKVVISGNTVLGADTTGIVVGEVTNTYRVKDIVAEHNIVLDSQQDRVGDLPDTVTGGISFWHVDGGVISGNRSGNSEGNDTQGYGVKIVDCTNITARDNETAGARLGSTYVEASTGIRAGDVFDVSAELASDHVVNNVSDMSDTEAAVTDTLLRVTIAAPGTYDFSGHLIYQSTETADAQIKMITPGGTSGRWVANSTIANASSANAGVSRQSLVPNSTTNLGGVGGSGYAVALPQGRITFINTGDFWIRFAQGSAEATDTILRAESWIALKKVG